METPKIIHQIWSSKRMPLPEVFKELSETWKEKHPDWQYILWDDAMMDGFMRKHYPQYIDTYNSFLYDIQRWDTIRYLILYEMGGMYVDFDMECLENVEPLLQKGCCFGTDTDENIIYASHVKGGYLNNTFITSTPKHPFIGKIVEHVFDENRILPSADTHKLLYVLQTSGALMLSDTYDAYEEKDDVYIIPACNIAPFSVMEASAIRRGDICPEWEERLQQAYAVHYFMGTWGYNSK